MEKRARLKLSLDRLCIQNEEEKDSFLFYLSSHSWFQVDRMYICYRTQISSKLVWRKCCKQGQLSLKEGDT